VVPDPAVRRTSAEEPTEARPVPSQPTALATPEAATPPVAPIAGALPLDACIRRVLEANATVRAARFNIDALKHRIPQVTALDDPVVSNTIYPIPMVAPQYSLMGYMPYSVLLAQQFPWFGTLRLRGEAASQDVKVALFELAAAQLDAVEGVKRAYLDLQFNERAEALLLENRKLASDFLQVAKERYRTASATQADVLRAEVAVSDIDRELETTREAANEARAELARLMHAGPDAEFRTAGEPPASAVPAEITRLYQLAVAARPDLQGRLAAIARDRTAVELARKRYKPNVTLGLSYALMEERGAVVGEAADGMPNLGMFIGFNLPVYRSKLAAGVCEAEARVAADAALYEAERDQSHRDIKDLFVQARSLRNVADLLRRSNLPAARQVLELTASDYRAGNAGVDLLSVLSATRDVLQIELQVAQLEAELGKTLASLERAVGVQLNEHPPDPSALATPPEPSPADVPGPPPPADEPGPFRGRDQEAGRLVEPRPLEVPAERSPAGAAPAGANRPPDARVP
jgi:outer membrane protein TolC